MARATRTLGVVLLAAMALAGEAGPAAAQDARLTLRVRNDANIPDGMVEDAKTAVVAIYAKAGVGVTFVDAKADYLVVLLSRHTAGMMHPSEDAVGFTPGSETERGRVAYVLQPRVDQIADGYTTARPVVLAAAIAHEVGHLLLFNAHSDGGIMRSAWNQADFRRAVRGDLVFTTEQAARIRARLAGTAQEIAVTR